MFLLIECLLCTQQVLNKVLSISQLKKLLKRKCMLFESAVVLNVKKFLNTWFTMKHLRDLDFGTIFDLDNLDMSSG